MSPAPSSFGADAVSRRPESAFGNTGASGRSAPSRDASRWSSARPSAPASAGGGSRIERSAPARPEQVERRATGRTYGSAPTRAPQAERSRPASPSSARSVRSSQSADGLSGTGRQARSRNGR
jgi:hypothetical protein